MLDFLYINCTSDWKKNVTYRRPQLKSSYSYISYRNNCFIQYSQFSLNKCKFIRLQIGDIFWDFNNLHRTTLFGWNMIIISIRVMFATLTQIMSVILVTTGATVIITTLLDGETEYHRKNVVPRVSGCQSLVALVQNQEKLKYIDRNLFRPVTVCLWQGGVEIYRHFS